MKLWLSIVGAVAVLRATIPGPGSWSMLSTDGSGLWRVEASGYAWTPCEVTVCLPKNDTHRFFTVKFNENHD